MINIEVDLTRVVVQGPGPGSRYGHVMALVGQRYLMCIGGNDGESNEVHGYRCSGTGHLIPILLIHPIGGNC